MVTPTIENGISHSGVIPFTILLQQQPLCDQIVWECHQNDSSRFQWFVLPDCIANVTITTHSVFNGLYHQIVLGMSPE